MNVTQLVGGSTGEEAADTTSHHAASDVVDEYGSGLLLTKVTAVPGGHRWHRRPGRMCPAPFHPLTNSLTDALRSQTGDPSCGARAVVGEATADGGRSYPVPGRHSLAHLLMVGGGPNTAVPGGTGAVAEALRGAGALLARLHGLAVPAEAARPARGALRLHAWLSGATTAGGADPAALLGAAATAPLAAWAAETVAPCAGVLSHGAPGLGSLVPSSLPGEDAVLLTGEDVCAAPRHMDLGHLVGELVELRWLLGRAAVPEAWQRLVDAVLDGYMENATGASVSRACLARGIALRVALHAHDSAAYVAGGSGPAALYGVLAARLAEEAGA